MSPEWMVWNLTLAAVPALLSIPLFRPEARPTVGWWATFAVFVAFLPNAPYVLTDIIHFADDVRASQSDLWVAFYLIPKYGGFILAGFGCYVVSVVRLQRWLRARGRSLTSVAAVVGGLHVLCTVGILLGRVFRLNSWDLLVRPHAVLEAVTVPSATTVVVLLLTVMVLAMATLAPQLVTIRPRRR